MMRTLLIAFVVFVPALNASAGDLELLQNGGFEEGLASWTKYSNSGAMTYEPDSKVKHAGERALRLERSGGEGWDFLKQFADVPAGYEELVVRLAYKVEKGARFEAVLYFLDAAGEPVGKGSIPLLNEGKTRKFELFEETIEIPEDARRCGIDVISKQKGTFWLDEVSIAIPGAGLPELGPLELANPDFEDGLRFWEELPNGSGATQARVDRKVKAKGKASLHLERKSPRRFPEDGLRTSAPEVGRARKAQLRVEVRVGEGCEGVVVLQAFDLRGVALETERVLLEPTDDEFEAVRLKLALPKGTARVDVLLCVRGAGEVWFDGLELKKG